MLLGCMYFLKLFHFWLCSAVTYPAPYHLSFTWAFLFFLLQLLFLPIKGTLLKMEMANPYSPLTEVHFPEHKQLEF